MEDKINILFNIINNEYLKLSEDELRKEFKKILKYKYNKDSKSELNANEIENFKEILEIIYNKLKTNKIEKTEIINCIMNLFILKLPNKMNILCESKDMFLHLKSVLKNYIDNNDFSGYEKDLFELMDLRKTQYLWSLKSNTDRVISTKLKISKDIADKERELGISMGQRQKDVKEDSYKEWSEVINRVEEYVREHIGEFSWQCSHCQGMNLNNVPHFAFDSVIKSAVFNKEIFELIRKYYTNEGKGYDGKLSISDGAKILRTSCIGILAIAWERNFDLGIKYDLNNPSSLLPYISEDELKEIEKVKSYYGISDFKEIKSIEQKFEKIDENIIIEE